MRSVVVVFPASMWAMMPMFLQRSNGTVLGTTLVCSFWGSDLVVDLVIGKFSNLVIEIQNLQHFTITQLLNFPITQFLLPAVMRECLVCFRHAMHIFFLLDGGATAVGRVQQLVAQLVDHSLFATPARIANDPADG
jgi:hypothetical protein